ncbi:MAG TPA: hypothetical protein VKX96_05770 [Chloroflexota bacterium]|nr:hypothetical protein [Chloroflexota bacterium]
MGLQAIAFFLAFALPVSMVDRISSSDFKASTKWTLAVIAVCLGALPLLLVNYTGAFLQFIQIIRLSYLAFAIVIVAVIGHSGSVACKQTEEQVKD